ncbi:MAG: M14 family zinc carboxypeptidase [Planctomycetota bacterium]
MVRPAWLSSSILVMFLAVGAAAQVPSPVEVLGHEVGADRRLCNYTDLVRYFRAVEAATGRVRLVDIGATSYGQRMCMAVVTSEANHARLDELRAISTRLCRARDADPAVAAALAEHGRAVVWIDAGLHATEVIAGQNVIELVWQLASRDDAEARRILDEVVLLACPVNPDGLELVANAYAATGRTQVPVLYQRYVGHDNNRDFYACNQLESTNVSRVLFTDWCPQIVYNHHQTAPAGTILFTPPFRDPFNYRNDPMVIRGIEVVSAVMNERFAREGKPGVISRSGAPYSGWWNGGLRSTCYFHNIIGILTEAYGRPEPSKIVQTLDRRLPYGDYPDPVPTQEWHARQTIEYLQTANFAILDHAARYRRELLTGIWRMGRNSIERGGRDHWTPTPALVAAAKARGDDDAPFADPLLRDPRAYVLPRGQRDWSAVLRFARALQRSGVELHVATAPFTVAGVACDRGSIVVQAAQAYRPHVLDMFEPQWHPDDFEDGKPVPPYDAAGWTLALQMGVEFVRCLDALEGPFAPLDGEPVADPAPADGIAAGAAGWRLDPADSHAVIAANRLLRAGAPLERLGDGGLRVPETVDGAAVAAALKGLGALATPLATAPTAPLPRLRAPRVGLFDVYGGHMGTGWIEWLLREFGFDVQLVFGVRIAAGDLRADYDALLFCTGLPAGRDLRRLGAARDEDSLRQLAEALPPFEDWSTLPARATRLDGESTWPALREFLAAGGTVIGFGGECEALVRQFELPVRIGTVVADPDVEGGERRTRRDEFWIPGSLVALQVDAAHPFAAGCAPEPAAMFTRRCPVLTIEAGADEVHAVAIYRADDTLVSGWALGAERLAGTAAMLDAPVGEGRVVLCGADLTYRGQPLGTCKLVFQALLAAAQE